MMGILLDKYFFTPFSYYLRLIRPLYILPFDFEQELIYFLETYDSDDDVAAAFFAPCSSYTLTALGTAFFDVKPDTKWLMNTPPPLSFILLKERLFNKPDLMNSLPIWVNQPNYAFTNDFNSDTAILAAKIKLDTDTTIWLQLDIPNNISLHRLYLEVIMRFALIRNDEYSFFHDEYENPITEYASQKRARRNNKTSETVLSALDFEYMKTLILIAYNQCNTFQLPFMHDDKMPSAGYKKTNLTNEKFIIEVTEIKKRESGKVYPYMHRASKNFKAMYGV
jgi:hypothetical protein